MSNMLRSQILKPLAVFLTASTVTKAYCDSAFAFDNRGFPITYVHPKLSTKNPKPMHLSAVGMRKKNFFVVEVDVYLIALSLSDDALQGGKMALFCGNKLTEALLGTKNSTQDSSLAPRVSTRLKFVRQVTTAQVVEAFNEAFQGCNAEAVSNFKTILSSSIGSNGMKVGEEITFYWLKTGGLLFEKDGETSEVINDPEIEKRLLEVYVDPSRTVSPELVNSFKKYLESLSL